MLSSPSALLTREDLCLHEAIARGNKSLLKRLLDSGVSPLQRDGKGRTPLHYAAESGSTDIVHLLMKGAEKVTLYDKNALTPLHLAVMNGRWEVALLLLGAFEPLTPDLEGLTPLHMAMRYKIPTQNTVKQVWLYMRVLLKMIHRTPNINNRTLCGDTALSIAVQSHQTVATYLLLKNKADPSILNEKLLGPLDYSVLGRNISLAILLSQFGADPNQSTHAGSPLEKAKSQNLPEIVVVFKDPWSPKNHTAIEIVKKYERLYQDFLRWNEKQNKKEKKSDKREEENLRISLQIQCEQANNGASTSTPSSANWRTIGPAAGGYGNLYSVSSTGGLGTHSLGGGPGGVGGGSSTGLLPVSPRGGSKIISKKKFAKTKSELHFPSGGQNNPNNSTSIPPSPAPDRPASLIGTSGGGGGGNSSPHQSPTVGGGFGNGGIGEELIEAIMKGDKSELKKILQTHKASVYDRDNHLQTPLHYTSSRGSTKLGKVLLEAGADPNALDLHGRTPLSLALSNGFWSTAEMLLSSGADVMISCHSDNTALHYAVGGSYTDPFEYLDILSLLVSKGIDINQQNKKRHTALASAVLSCQPLGVYFLLQNSASPNIDCGDGMTALHIGCSQGQTLITRLLVNAGADYNLVWKPYGDAMRTARHFGHGNVVEVLLDPQKEADEAKDLADTLQAFLHLARQ